MADHLTLPLNKNPGFQKDTTYTNTMGSYSSHQSLINKRDTAAAMLDYNCVFIGQIKILYQ
jgi:hypothetical protein